MSVHRFQKIRFENSRRGVDYIACGTANHTLTARNETMKHQGDLRIQFNFNYLAFRKETT